MGQRLIFTRVDEGSCYVHLTCSKITCCKRYERCERAKGSGTGYRDAWQKVLRDSEL